MEMATKLKRWTLDEVHRLPEDGNKYELVRGDLFVTPPPTDDHESILARVSRSLDPYVEANGLGLVYHPRSVVRFEGSEVEPDLMVRRPAPESRTLGSAPRGRSWSSKCTPIQRAGAIEIKRNGCTSMRASPSTGWWILTRASLQSSVQVTRTGLCRIG